MKLLILFCVITITIATSVERQKILDILDGNSVTWSSFEVKKQVGSLPALYKPLTSEDEKATKKAGDYAEFLRPHFPTGYENIPPLDPYQPVIEPIVINFYELISAELRLTGVNVTGAQKFKLGDLALRLKDNDTRIRVDGAVNLTSLQVDADFNANVKVGTWISLKLSGKFTAQITDLKASGAGGTYLIKLAGEDRDQINAVELDGSCGQVVIKIKFDNPNAAQLVKVAVPDQAEIDEIQKIVGVLSFDMALKEINKELAKYNDKEIRAIIQ